MISFCAVGISQWDARAGRKSRPAGKKFQRDQKKKRNFGGSSGWRRQYSAAQAACIDAVSKRLVAEVTSPVDSRCDAKPSPILQLELFAPFARNDSCSDKSSVGSGQVYIHKREASIVCSKSKRCWRLLFRQIIRRESRTERRRRSCYSRGAAACSTQPVRPIYRPEVNRYTHILELKQQNSFRSN